MDILDTLTLKVKINYYSYSQSLTKKKINLILISKIQKFYHVLMLRLLITFHKQYHIIRDHHKRMLIK